MISFRRRLASTAAIAVVVALLLPVLARAGSVAWETVYLPVVRGAVIRTTGPVYPPRSTFCQLQTSAAYVIDPRTDAAVYGCESKSGHGYIVFGDRGVLLLDHVATGSGSLTIVDGSVYVVAARDDGGLQVQEVPTKP